jgi:predicted acylesterase/phospholipase RssA
MKYLCIGPASMGIYSMIGTLKALEPALKEVREISGASAGSILALFIALGMSTDEILEKCLEVDIPKFVKLSLACFINKFGFVAMEPIRELLVELCDGRDPTFGELDTKVYVSAYCLNTARTEYFSKDTHPDMKVIDAVLMSIAIPMIFSAGKFEGRTYVDGGTAEKYPMTPFLDKKPHQVTVIVLKMENVYQDSIDTPRQFVEALVRSTLAHRTATSPGCNLVEINVGGVNVFDFNMEYETKVRLFNLGYNVIKNVK